MPLYVLVVGITFPCPPFEATIYPLYCAGLTGSFSRLLSTNCLSSCMVSECTHTRAHTRARTHIRAHTHTCTHTHARTPPAHSMQHTLGTLPTHEAEGGPQKGRETGKHRAHTAALTPCLTAPLQRPMPVSRTWPATRSSRLPRSARDTL